MVPVSFGLTESEQEKTTDHGINKTFMKPFKNLSVRENDALLTFPVYTSLLAANGDGKLDEAEKISAIKFAQTKTFSGGLLLRDYYLEVDKVFESNLEQINNDLPKDQDNREAAIKNELLVLGNIVLKLNKKYSSAIHHSMKSFQEHVLKAHHSVLVDFILPIPIPGLTK
jgi:hypothetical protein